MNMSPQHAAPSVLTIEPVAFFRSPLTSKFGIPRQSGLVEGLHGVVEFVGEYRQAEALRGLDGYDYVWLIWGFSANVSAPKHPTVRPPLLGGNERMGVWATRSPFRPNNLGLSSVRLLRVDADTMTILVAGADLMDGTPIYDVKPYLPYVDSHADARAGFTEQRTWQTLQVAFSDEAAAALSAADREVLRRVLEQDPRPQYHADDGRCYGMPYGDYNVRFTVCGRLLCVESVEKLS